MTFISQTAPLHQTPWASSLLEQTEKLAAMLLEIMERRRMRMSLNKLSAKDLRDIGLTRNDLTSIAHLSLPSSGALELSKIGKSRAGNW